VIFLLGPVKHCLFLFLLFDNHLQAEYFMGSLLIEHADHPSICFSFHIFQRFFKKRDQGKWAFTKIRAHMRQS
jgi:hypothetical protein